MRTITDEELQDILAKHKKWLNDEVGGVRADLRNVDLSYADMKSANLQSADLQDATFAHANLTNAILSGANLKSAVLRCTNLCGAVLQFADLTNAILSGAILNGADLSEADLRFVNLQCANLNHANLQGAKLSHANLKYARRPWLIYAGPIGSRKAETLYFADYDNIRCGCWNNYKGGTLAEFKKRINEVYPADSENEEYQRYREEYQRYREEYLLAIKMFEGMREAYLKKCNGGEKSSEKNIE